MPTRSDDSAVAKPASVNEDWAARPVKPPRSVFNNFTGHDGPELVTHPSAEAETARRTAPTLQERIDTAMARGFVYRFLALAYEDPTEAGWRTLCSPESQAPFRSAISTVAGQSPGLTARAREFQAQLKPEAFEDFMASYLAAFGHAARGRCPLNEIEYGDIKADPLFQPHRLADLAAFYRAFGLELGEQADERPDHICLEFEFLCVLAAKEAYALEHQLDPDTHQVCHDAQRQFLRDHLGRWIPAFTRRLARLAGDSPLGALARLTGAFVEADCARFGVAPGSEDLLLRPVDESGESLCASCGLSQLPPGGATPTQP